MLDGKSECRYDRAKTNPHAGKGISSDAQAELACCPARVLRKIQFKHNFTAAPGFRPFKARKSVIQLQVEGENKEKIIKNYH